MAANNYEFMDEEARRERNEKLDAELAEYMEKRRVQLEEENRELEELKERQAERKAERAREMAEMAERMREAEEIHKQEEEDRRQKQEAKKHARILAKQKTGGTSVFDVFGKEGNPKNEKTELTPEEIAAQKVEYINACQSKLNVDGLGTDDLRARIKDFHARIYKLEANRYDLEQRQVEQEYDLKELSDRESQKARNKAAAAGLDTEDAASSKHPPKVRLYSKNDRQIDRRSFGDRMGMYNQPRAEKIYKIFHGSAKPPAEWQPKDNEDLDNLKKVLDGFKYVELEPVEDAKPPVPVIPVAEVPEKDAFELIPVDENAQPPPPPPAADAGPEPPAVEA